MKISFIKYEKDNRNYKIPQLLGINLVKIKEPEELDNTIEMLRKQNYNTIIIPNELASFSEKITKKYKYDEKLKIIITPTKM